ncbi:MAG: cyclic nucleotide-binding domain-containing protein, partial [Myxococcota bacterium]
MTSRRLLLKVRAEDGCPLYDAGDQLVLHLPGIVTHASSAVCALTVAAFLKDVDGADCPRARSDAWPETFRCPRADRPVLFSVEPVEERPASAPPARFDTEDLPNAVLQLRRIPVFRALSDGFLSELARHLETQRFEPGSVLVEKGHPGQAFFMLIEGEVEIVGYADEKMKSVVNVLEAPSCFGEISLLTGSLTAASVTARTAVTVFVLPSTDFQRMMREHADMAQRFTRLLATRVESANSLIVRAGSQGFRGKLSVMNAATVLQVLAEARQSG